MEARESLNAWLFHEHLDGVPFFILGNKIDTPQAAFHEEELSWSLGVGVTAGKFLHASNHFPFWSSINPKLLCNLL
jgi:hypothetical protein